MASAVQSFLGSVGAYAAVCTVAAILLSVVFKLAGPFDEDLPPWPLFKFGLWATRCLDAMRDGLLPPHVRTLEIGFSYVRPQVLHVLAALNLPELLHSGPKTAEELAPLAGVYDVDKLEHVLRAAVALRLLSISRRSAAGSVRYANTALSNTLRDDHPRSVRAIVCTNMEDCLPAYRQLVPALTSKQDAVPFELHNDGLDLWEYLKRKPRQEAQFSAAMTSMDVTDFGWAATFDRIIDVAGAHGAVLGAIMAANPRLRGVLFDLPQVIERAKQEWKAKRSALLGRTDFVGGDFFDAATLPAPAAGSRDVYMLRNVLHDWNDAKTLHILRSLRTNMGTSKTATLAVVEVIPHSDIAHEDLPARQMLDIQMIVVVGGKERSPEEWEPMLSETGFKLRTIIPTRGSFRIMLADPV